MVGVELERESYCDVVVLTVDDHGVEGLAAALKSLPDNPAVRSLEIETGEDGRRLRVRYESAADRVRREEKEAARHAQLERRGILSGSFWNP